MHKLPSESFCQPKGNKKHTSMKEVLSKVMRASAMGVAMCIFTCSASGATRPSSRQADFSIYSLNWSGYISDISSVLAQSAVGVKGTFNIPKISGSCFAKGASAYRPLHFYEMAAWVGIGGTEENSLVQTGIIAEYSVLSLQSSNFLETSQKLSYLHISPFYEMLPLPPVRLHGLDMRPGDEISASILKSGKTKDSFTISLKDESNGKSFKKTLKYPLSNGYAVPHLSTEWVVERPAYQLNAKTFFQMPNFDPVTFKSSGMETTFLGLKGVEQFGIIGIGELIKIDMSTNGTASTALTNTSSLANSGSGFYVTDKGCPFGR